MDEHSPSSTHLSFSKTPIPSTVASRDDHRRFIAHVRMLFIALGLFSLLPLSVTAQVNGCPNRPDPIGATDPEVVVPDPFELYSRAGTLNLTLTVRAHMPPSGTTKKGVCFVYEDRAGAIHEAPVLRVNPSDRVSLTLHNHLPSAPIILSPHDTWGINSPCSPRPEISNHTTNLHFHGLNIPPRCKKDGKKNSDEVISALVHPSASQRFDFKIPADDPSGLFWYHPHVHSLSGEQLLGGMTGVLVVDGIEQMHNAPEGLRERILVLRDAERQDEPTNLRYIDRPDLLPGGSLADVTDGSGNAVAQALLDGQAVETTIQGIVKMTVMPPWKDVSLNWIPIVFRPTSTGLPAYSAPPVIKMDAHREFWRIANTAADSYFRIQVHYDGIPQPLRIVAMDGVPLGKSDGTPQIESHAAEASEQQRKGRRRHKTVVVDEILMPPAARVEFVLEGPKKDATAELISLFYETNADYHPRRTLAKIQGPTTTASSRTHRIPTAKKLRHRARFRDVTAADFTPPPEHTLVFHQQDIDGRTVFYIEEPKPDGTFDDRPFSMTEKPRVTVPHGTVQTWKIVNQAPEAHVFHIHQIHFRVLKRSPESDTTNIRELDRLALRDTIELPAWDQALHPEAPPFVTLRMFFNDADIQGNFVYHCHILEHEDNGMMAIVQVE